MRIEEKRTYWILLVAIKYSGVTWFIRDAGIPTGGGRTASIREAKRFASRDDAIEWGNHLTSFVIPHKLEESCTYVLTEDK